MIAGILLVLGILQIIFGVQAGFSTDAGSTHIFFGIYVLGDSLRLATKQ